MFSSHGFLRKYNKHFLGLCGYWKISIKGAHSLHHFKQKKKPPRQIRRNIRKSFKPVEKENVYPKVYMRDVIGDISNILRYSTWASAQQQLEKLSIRWDSYTINRVLKTHPPMEKAWLFFDWASRLKGFKHDQFTYTTMLDIFGEAGRISSMNYVFQQMLEKGIKIDAVTYTSILHWLSNDGDVDGSVKVWAEMKVKCCRPTLISYTAYMKVLFDNNRVKEATEVYKEMLQSGCSPNCFTYTVLMEYLVGSGKYNEALEIFSKMQEAGVQPDKATCNILVEKCCKAGQTRAIAQILKYMKDNSLVLRYPIFLEAREALKLAGESDVLLRHVNPHFSVEDISKGETFEFIASAADVHLTIDRGLVLYLLKKQNLVAVDRLLAGMIEKNTQLDSGIISTIVEVNCAHGRPNGALLAFEYSVRMCIYIKKAAYLALIGVFIRTNLFPKVMEIVEEMVRAGFSIGTYMGSLLIYRLGCARKPGSATKMFNLLPDDQKSTATYTALIGAYFSSGNADEGLKTYETMRSKGIHAASGTYNVLIAGLQKSGRFHEAETYRKEKKSLQTDGHSQDVSMEEKICDLLFAGGMVY